jgi:large subunit ribosomal protein L4
MASLPVYDRTGKEVGRYDLAITDLAPKINKQLLHDAVVMYQANLRQGTFRTKTRSEVAGTTKKMYRQKGTGNARAGSRRTNIRVGGGHGFAKRPRDFSYRLPRKALQLATRMAVAAKLENEQLVVIDDLAFSSPKTRDMVAILKALNLDGQSTLVTTNGHDTNVYKSARNIERVTISPVDQLNALAILKPRRMLVTKAALDALKSRVPAKRADAEQAEQVEA